MNVHACTLWLWMSVCFCVGVFCTWVSVCGKASLCMTSNFLMSMLNKKLTEICLLAA